MEFTTESQRTQRIIKQRKYYIVLCALRGSVVKMYSFFWSL